MPMTVLDLFVGAGGLSAGFRQAGFTVVAGADSDPDACATFAANFPDATTAWGDLRQGDIRDQMLDAAGGDLDVLVGGPPCQAFSQMRNHDRLIDDPRNSLYREFVRLLDEMRPRAFLMENVMGMREVGVDGQVAEDLALAGRYCVSAQPVNAVDFGVPQSRKRLLFLGVRADVADSPPILTGSRVADLTELERTVVRGRISYKLKPVDTDRAAALTDQLVDPHDATVVTAAQALGDLAWLRAGRRDRTVAVADLPDPSSAYQKAMRDGLADDADLSNVRVPRINKDTILRLKGVPQGGNARDLAEELKQRHLTGQKWGPETGSGRLERLHYGAYRRLHPDYWAWTLNTKADAAYHWEQPRALSVREFARLQSFPDSFRIVWDQRTGDLPGRISGGPAHSMYRQVGNAVPPLLAKAAAEALSAVL